MRNKHTFKDEIPCKCPFDSCGKEFQKTVTVQYITNQKGDVIEHKIM